MKAHHSSQKQTLAICLLIFIIILIIFILVNPFPKKKQTLDLENTQKQVMEDIKSAKDYEKKTQNWLNNGQDNIFVKHRDVGGKTSSEKKVDVLKYFIVGLLQNNADIFASSIYPEIISKDLFKSDNPDKNVVLQDIMKRITRDGKLNGIDYSIDKGAFNSEKDAITVTFHYKDHKTAKVNLQVMPNGDSHTSTDTYYVIKTSTWDIIKTIKKRGWDKTHL